MVDKCTMCNHLIHNDCNWNQGRCPHRKPMIDKPFPIWLLLVLAPFIIGAWIITNPKKVWEQAKKEWKL